MIEVVTRIREKQVGNRSYGQGPGIPEENLYESFNKFFRLNRTRRLTGPA